MHAETYQQTNLVHQHTKLKGRTSGHSKLTTLQQSTLTLFC